jgi:hypothetical protein
VHKLSGARSVTRFCLQHHSEFFVKTARAVCVAGASVAGASDLKDAKVSLSSSEDVA